MKNYCKILIYSEIFYFVEFNYEISFLLEQIIFIHFCLYVINFEYDYYLYFNSYFLKSKNINKFFNKKYLHYI